MRAIRRALAATAGAVILSGCELPTEAPLLQQRWSPTGVVSTWGK